MLNKIKTKYNPSTLSGALDIIVIEHPDGTLRSSPWHVRFGKLGLLHHAGKVISVTINDQPAPFLMYVDSSGRGQFFSTQIVNQTNDQSISYPLPPVASVSIRPKDVRSILAERSSSSPKKNNNNNNNNNYNNNSKNERNENNNNEKLSSKVNKVLKCQKIRRDTAVDLEAALDFEDPDPLPVSTISSSLDLAQSMKTANIDNSHIISSEGLCSVPSPLLLSSIRYLLHFGKNTVTFTVSSLIQGPKVNLAHLFLWQSDEKIVVSDVDGTVTSSDLLGHVLPTFGRDWTHPGLVSLYNRISEKKNVKFLYLSSRPIGEASLTRKMLNKIRQGEEKMPDGPLITCPDLAFPAMAREMQHRPQEFKIPTLKEIKELFLPLKSPFLFGFGNRKTDVISYKEVGLADNQILLFDTKHRVLDGNLKILFPSIEKLTPEIDHFIEGEVE